MRPLTKLLPYAGIMAGLCASIAPVHGQLSVSPQTDLEQLARSISGAGVQISNPSITCHAQGYGEFTYSGTQLGLESGVILTSGRIADAIGPNNVENTTFQQGTAGSALLNTVTGRTTYDACRFEFDIIPSGDSLSFAFVFGGEEYNEWVGSQYNDVFGFFISGPGITGDPGIGNDKNIALIPGTSIPVAINNVNAGQNSDYYQYNAGGQQLQMDGFTRGLTARTTVQPCETYHLKLILADASDRKFDSWVFIERIQSPNVSLSTRTVNGTTNMVEGCNPGWIRFTREPVTPDPLTLTYYLQGTATNGTDYTAIGDVNPNVAQTITIPAGQPYAEQPVNPLDDASSEPTEHLRILLGNPNCAGSVIDSIDFAITDTLIASVSPVGMQTICVGSSTQFNIDGGLVYAWSPATGLSCTDCPNPIASPTVSTTYTVVINEGSCVRTMSRMVRVSNPTISSTVTQPLCDGSTNGAINITVSGGFAPYTFAWTGPNGFTAASEDVLNLDAGNYTVLVTDAFGCSRTELFDVGSPATLSLALTPSILPFGQNIACNGGSTGTLSLGIVGGTAPYGIAWTGPNGFTSVEQNLTGIVAGTYQVLVTDANGCMASGSYAMTASAPLLPSIGGEQHIACFGESTGQATASALGGTPPYSYSWDSSPVQLMATATNLPAGTRTATITDGYGCVATAQITITQPAQPLAVEITGTTDVLCHGALQGVATASASGGTGPYSYSWNTVPEQSAATANGLSAGTHTVTVTDASGCSATANAIINGPLEPIEALAEQITHVTCYGANDGTITIDVTGGSGSYTILWLTSPPQTGATASNLPPGDHWVQILDNNGCLTPKMHPITILGPDSPLIVDLVISPISCAGANDGAVDLTMSGGFPSYTHHWTDDFGNLTGTEDLTGLEPETYHLHAFDGFGCTFDTTFTLIDPPAIQVNSAITPAECQGTATGAIDVTASGGTGSLTFQWTGPNGFTASAEDLTGLNSGIYQLIVTDANGCTQITSHGVSQPGSMQLTATASQYNGPGISCANASDGSIAVDVTGGTAPYIYAWTGPDGFSSSAEDLVNLSAGTYSLVVTDDNGCQVAHVQVLDAPLTLIASAIVTDHHGFGITCAGANDGSMVGSVAGGTAPFSFAWTGPGGFSSSVADLSNLSPGSYQVVITDANGCTANSSATVTEPTQLLASATVVLHPGGTAISCAAANDGAIDLTVSGGTAPYTIEWTNGLGYASSQEDINGLEPGGYQVNITDANGCVTSDFVVLEAPEAIGMAATLSSFNGLNVSCATSTDGSIDLSPFGGTAPYTVTWSNGASSEDLISIGAGTYEAIVTDANGCTASASYTLVGPEPTDISLNLAQQPGGAHISCHGAADGSIDAVVNGGTAPLVLEWSGPNGFTSSSATIDNLLAGEYSLQVTDANGCVATLSATLLEPLAVAVSITSTTFTGDYNIPCAGLSVGQATAIASGGTPGYAFVWSGPNGYGSNAASIFSLAAGDYDLTVTDSNGCIGIGSIVLLEPDVLDAVILIPDLGGYPVSCIGADGSATVNATGGTGPYAFNWTGSNGFTSTQQAISGLNAGTYAITVTDANGCSWQESVTLSAPAAIEAAFAFTPNLCPDGATGSIDLSVSGGSAPYAFTWTGPDGYTSAAEDPAGLLTGAYTVSVTDGLGCSGAFSANLQGPAPISSGTYVSFYGIYNLQCLGDSSGTIELAPAGGTTPFSVSLSGPGGFTSTALINQGLIAGDYLISITDAQGCAMDTLVTLVEPATQVNATLAVSVYPSGTNVSCFGASDGWIDATVTGGTGPYTFDWRGPDSLAFSSEDVFNLPAGTYAYELVVTDANQCAFSTVVTLTQPDSALYANGTMSNYNGFGVSCPDAQDGTIAMGYGGGNGGFGFSWSGPSGFTSTEAALQGLPAGTYQLTLTDMNGCALTQSYAITAPPAVTILLDPSAFNGGYQVSCHGGSNGSISAVLSGGVGGFQVQWTGPNGYSASGQGISNLTAGTYCALVTDANSCSNEQCITLTEPQALMASTMATDASCGQLNGAIDLSVTGGSTPFTYAWSNGSNTQDLNGLNAGSFSVTVTDANGCSTGSSADVLATPAALGTGIAGHVLCNGGADGAIDVTMSAGTAPFTYAWSNGSTQEDLAGLSGGGYNVVVTDANGCTWSSAWTITESPAIEIDANVSGYPNGYEVSSYQGSDGSIQVAANGGTEPYTYLWNNGSTGPGLTGIPAGSYTVTVTDANGCSVTRTLTLESPNDLLMPTGYTPNGDGYNDHFFIQGLDAYPTNLLVVLNRWGNVVFEQLNYKNDWAGDNAHGESLPNGTYFAMLNINNGERMLQGYVDLRR
ncbi:MAG: choice-of-anchor L domain-containing protein [Flavobacteriales bacterium]|nr:choice-of-anchor L domain-containing protein [Flavobacteriales bacterium]